jgi:hypothetical protein
MRVGSLVEYVGPIISDPSPGVIRVPKKGERLTIRGLFDSITSDELLAAFDEYEMGRDPEFKWELGCPVKYLRELLPPEEQAEVIAEANEIIKEHELIPA